MKSLTNEIGPNWEKSNIFRSITSPFKSKEFKRKWVGGVRPAHQANPRICLGLPNSRSP